MLQTHLNDLSSDSIPLLLLALLAKSIHHFRASMLALLHFLGLVSSQYPEPDIDPTLFSSIGSGLSGIIVLAEQLDLNRVCSRSFDRNCDGEFGPDCVVCMSRLNEGEQVRVLGCRHVYHRKCFDECLNHFLFSCSLCKRPLVCEESVDVTARRVGEELFHSFPVPLQR